MIIGVLGLQGAFIEHYHILQRMNVNCSIVKNKHDLSLVDALIIPGDLTHRLDNSKGENQLLS